MLPLASSVQYPREFFWLKASLAFIWLVTGISVISPYYREVGNHYLSPLSLPPSTMFVTCAFEILLGIRVLWGNFNRSLTLLQIALIAGFTLILAWIEPPLLIHPFGILTKNIPILAIILVLFFWQKNEKLTPKTFWLLRFGVASIWITEGLFPKIFFQQEFERQVVLNSGLVPIDPTLFLYFMGACQLGSGLLVFIAKGRFLSFLLIGQMLGLLFLPILVSLQDSSLWVHPFGPLTKNVPILMGTFMVYRLCPSFSS